MTHVRANHAVTYRLTLPSYVLILCPLATKRELPTSEDAALLFENSLYSPPSNLFTPSTSLVCHSPLFFSFKLLLFFFHLFPCLSSLQPVCPFNLLVTVVSILTFFLFAPYIITLVSQLTRILMLTPVSPDLFDYCDSC